MSNANHQHDPNTPERRLQLVLDPNTIVEALKMEAHGLDLELAMKYAEHIRIMRDISNLQNMRREVQTLLAGAEGKDASSWVIWP